MIRFTCVAGNGRRLVGLGLSDENLKLLRAGRPIEVSLEEMLPGIKVDVLLFAGRDEYDMTEQLAGLIGPETRLIVSREGSPGSEHPDAPGGPSRPPGGAS